MSERLDNTNQTLSIAPLEKLLVNSRESSGFRARITTAVVNYLQVGESYNILYLKVLLWFNIVMFNFFRIL